MVAPVLSTSDDAPNSKISYLRLGLRDPLRQHNWTSPPVRKNLPNRQGFTSVPSLKGQVFSGPFDYQAGPAWFAVDQHQNETDSPAVLS